MPELQDDEAITLAILLGAEFSQGLYWHGWIERGVGVFSHATKADAARALIERLLDNHRTMT